MERAEAIERVRKLSEVTVERGATPNEQEVATRKAERLIERFSLQLADFAPPPPPPPLGPRAPHFGSAEVSVYVNGQPVPATGSATFSAAGFRIFVRFG